MSEENHMNKEISNIILFYRKASNFLFWTWIYIILIVLSILFVFFIVGTIQINLSWDINANIKLGQIKWKEIIKANKIQILSNYSDKDVKFNILGGYIYSSWNDLYSYNNLSSFKDVVLPYSFYVDSGMAQEYKDVKNTDQKFLTTFVLTKILLNSKKQEDTTSTHAQPLKSLKDDGIEDTFNLMCLNSVVISPFCQNEINIFLDNIYAYDISKDMDGAKEMYDVLTAKGYKEEVCKAYQNYTLFSLDFNESFYSMFQDCGWKYLENYEFMKAFAQINTNIVNNSLDNKTSYNDDLTAYKLMSFQKLIYTDYQDNKNFNVDLIGMYFAFLENILQQNKLKAPYYDITYMFNNFYLLQIINAQKNNNNQKISEAIPKLIDKVNKTNKWDNVFIKKWLQKLIVNKDLTELLNKKVAVLATVGFSDNTSKFKSLVNSLSSYYSVETWIDPEDDSLYFSKGTLEKTFQVSGQKDKDVTLKLELFYKYNWDKFKLEKINIPEYPALQKIVNDMMKKDTDFGFPNFLEILQNYPLESQAKTNFCDILRTTNFSLGWDSINIDTCSETALKITKGTIVYEFGFDGEVLNRNSIKISDKIVEKQVYKALNWNNNIIKDTFLTILPNILNYKEESDKDQLVYEIINIKVKFQAFFGIALDDVTSIDENNFHLTFKLKEYDIQCDINKKENYRLNNLHLRANGKEYILKNFSLNLLESERSKINQFRIDPILYIKENLKK